VARISSAEGASFIYREGSRRYVPLRFAVRGRDLQTAIQDARHRVEAQVKLPEQVTLEWAGEYGELQAANRRLMVVVPFALLLIMGVLYAATRSMIDTAIIMAQIPVACLGGVLALFLTGTPFSISAAVGFISIFGLAVMDGILLSFFVRQLWLEGHPLKESIIMGAERLLGATMMADMVAAIGLLPAALSTRIGAQTQRPLAIVVIGGAVALMILTRILQPVLTYLGHRRLRLADQGRNGDGGVAMGPAALSRL
jgi:cobalt-zinc-cadmium resistance protein CzcA